MMNIPNADILVKNNYLPFILNLASDPVKVRWVDIGNDLLKEPFFDTAITAYRERNKMAYLETPLSDMIRLAGKVEVVKRKAFIFHMSRCGSTLLTNMLKRCRKNIVLCEPGLTWEVLDIEDEANREYVELALKSVIEIRPEVVAEAIYKLKTTGAQIRTQAPLLRNINNSADTWANMWQKQVELGCVPYYMFLVRDTGAQHYFSVGLQDALEIYRTAIRQIGGLGRTVRGPVMSVLNGKVELLDHKDGVYIMRYIQHRMEELSYRLFKGIGKYGSEPCWFDDLTEISSSDSVYFRKIQEGHDSPEERIGIQKLPALI